MKQDKGFREKVRAEVDQAVVKSTDYITDRIVSLVRELVPNEATSGVNDKFEVFPQGEEDAGWNDCRTEILSRLEEKP
jgi:hypothetical protein